MYKIKKKFHLIHPIQLVALLGSVTLVFFLVLPSSREFILNMVDDGYDIDLNALPVIDSGADPELARAREKLFMNRVFSNVAAQGDDPQKLEEIALAVYFNSAKTEVETIATVKLLLGSERPDLAGQIIETYENESGRGNADHSEEMILTKVSVFQQNNRSSEAFDAYYVFFQAQEKLSKGSLDKLLQLARLGNRTSEVIGFASDIEQFRKLEDSEAKDGGDVYTLLGDMALSGGNNDIAISHYEKAFTLDPSRVYLNAQMGKAYEWSGRPAMAFEYYAKSIGADDGYSLERLLDLAGGLYKTYELGKMLANYPGKVMELGKGLFVARIFIENGDNDRAYEWYEKICADEENADHDIYLEYISILVAAQEYERAKKLATRGKKQFAQILEFRSLLGEIHLSLLDYEKAFAEYYQLVTQYPNHSALTKTIDIGAALGKEEEITALLRDYRENGHLESAQLYEKLAMIEFRESNFVEFQSIIMEAYHKNPENAYLLEKLFLSYQKLNNVKGAISLLEQFPDKLLKNPYVLDYYLDHLLNNNQLVFAEQILNTHPKGGTFNGDIVENVLKQRYRARIATLRKDWDAAIAIYEKLNADNVLQDYQLIPYLELLILKKSYPEANKLIDKMSGLDHEDFYVHVARAYIYQGMDTKSREYIARVTTPLKLAHLWRDIGDYYENNNSKVMAADAYRKAMEYITAEIN